LPVNFPVSLPKADGLSAHAEEALQKCSTKYAEQVVKEAGRFTSGQHKEITAELIRDASNAIGRRGRRERSGPTVIAQLVSYLIAFVMAFIGPYLWSISEPAVVGIVVVVGLIATYSFYGDR
jgi:hypothetical protein